ncbi:hypothetical protein TCAL_10689 [Tigriopus californicus]|uniref:Dolichyl-diphosphooligosaccharide--protein glycosyltransferase subunit 1 n=2 Tax=Tigriopus californicus TaxID=6832 RepID=A0A553PG57_TIGCA|nr:hypothetical protein TCAL_10689 [Tigriopus californicus]
MVQEPLLLILAFFIFFALTIVYVRLDFAITKDESSEIRMRVAGLCNKIMNHQDKRFKQYEQIDEALAKYKAYKEQAQFQSAAKKVANEAKTENQAIVDLLPALKAISGDTAEKVAEIQRLDRVIREHQNNQAAIFDKFLTSKLNKSQFVEQELSLVKKRDEAREKIDQIYNHLRGV